MTKKYIYTIVILITNIYLSTALVKDTTYKVFQFPADKIPRIDGDTEDWSIVPESYAIKTGQLQDDSGIHEEADPKNLKVSVKVGWVKNMNKLYFLYEASDNYWDFTHPGLHNDIFEVVVDGDLSGGPLIDKSHRKVWTKKSVGVHRSKLDHRVDKREDHWKRHGVHAQNYHIFTPPKGKDWALVWGSQPWIKKLPFANAAYEYNFHPGDSGKLVLEFCITPFDYAGPEGPERAVKSTLKENDIIGLSWAIIDYDDAQSDKNNGFWNLSPKHTMYGQASYLCAFKLMPMREQFLKPIKADWSHKIIDMKRRLVAFKDKSHGKITSWKWDFGDGTSSNKQNPIHQYNKPGEYTVVLYVEGPEGKSRMSKVWDVFVK